MKTDPHAPPSDCRIAELEAHLTRSREAVLRHAKALDEAESANAALVNELDKLAGDGWTLQVTWDGDDLTVRVAAGISGQMERTKSRLRARPSKRTGERQGDRDQGERS